jgi:transcriptional antiterminator NusG
VNKVSQDSINAENQPLDASVESQPLESQADGMDENTTSTDAVIADDPALNTDGDLEADSDLDDDDDASDLPDEFDGDTAENVKPIEEADDSEAADEDDKQWYILKVQSNREKSICDGLIRRVKVEGLDNFFGEIIVPTEDVAEFKNGKRRVIKRKLFPGYIVVNMVLNEETWFLVRETPGIGDFTGSAGKPTPMLTEEIERIVKAAHPEEDDAEQIKTAIPFKLGDRVRIKEGTFENFEGDVDAMDEANGRVTIMINIFGRSTPVELEHWQIEQV